MFSLKKLQSRGDTIVEVMIVLAVLGLALSISYATANRSLQNARQAQENSEASNIVASQLEGLRTLVVSDPTVKNGDPFCVNASGATPTKAINTDAICNNLTSYGINIRIEHCGSIPPSSDPGTVCNSLDLRQEGTYLIKATWDNVRGDGQDSVTYSYRYHKPWN